MTDESQFHWAEGLKYVSEGIKGVFVLNDAAAVSILTFVGNLLANGGSTKTSFFVFTMLFLGLVLSWGRFLSHVPI